MGMECLKLEKWGVRSQWVLTDRDTGKCYICGMESGFGYYCPVSNRFWCVECNKRSVLSCGCVLIGGNPQHEMFKVVCKKEKVKGVGKR